MNHLIIPYSVYRELRDDPNDKFKLLTPYKVKNKYELDNGVMFFDENMEYIHPERLEIEAIQIHYVLLPRFFWKWNYPKLESFASINTLSDNKKIDITYYMDKDKELDKYYDLDSGNFKDLPRCCESKFEPREYQIPIITDLMNNIKEHKNFILQAAPGTGKTFMSIYLSQNFHKTVVIVPKKILADQWKKEYLKFTNIDPERINILEGSELQEIQDIINNSDVIITKPQSLLSQLKRVNIKDLQEIYKGIDYVIYDECHGAGAQGYSKTTSLFKTPYVTGLSATPFRRNLNEFLLDCSIGPVRIEADAEVLTPEIYIQKISKEYVEFSKSETLALTKRLNDYPMMLSLFNMFLNQKDNYLSLLSQWMKWFIDTNRQTVVLFSTNKLANNQLKNFQEKYPEFTQDEIIVLTGNSKKDAIDIAKKENRKIKEELKLFKESLDVRVKNKEIKRKEANEIYKIKREELKKIQDLNIEKSIDLYEEKIKNAKIIISNFGLLREGFDLSSLSGLIFGSPIIGKITIVQSLGRITRLHEDKPKPVALFPVTEVFESLNKNTEIIIRNNVRSTYPDARIQNV